MKKNYNKPRLILLLIGFIFWGHLHAKTEFTPFSVRFVYLVSADRTENIAYTDGIKMAALSIQAWYKKQMGSTFKLNSPLVEIAKSDKNATWFYANPNGENKDNWGYNNTYDEVHRLLKVQFFDPKYMWVIYSDGPGNSGRGGSSVCIMPEDDLLGLIGAHPEQKDINRWIAGLGHELGHALGLHHPKDTKKDADAIMWTGIYGKYPDQCYLTDEDKDILNKSAFFFNDEGIPNSGIITELIKYSYPGGEFKRLKNNKTNEYTWTETKTDLSTFYNFFEQSKDMVYYYLKSINRKLWIRIPLEGGTSHISVDEGVTWRLFQEMKKLN